MRIVCIHRFARILLNFLRLESAKGSLLTKRQINVRFPYFPFQVVQKTRYGILPMNISVHFPTLGGNISPDIVCILRRSSN